MDRAHNEFHEEKVVFFGFFFINFAYEPEVQADIAAFVNYVTPVDGVVRIRTGEMGRDAL